MKISKYISVIAAVAVIAGCQLEESIPENRNDRAVFDGSIETIGATRTTMDEYNNIRWSEGDRISIFQGTSAGTGYRLADEAIGSVNGKFFWDDEENGSEPDDAVQFAHNVAYYPECRNARMAYASADNDAYIIEGVGFSSTQNYREGSFANGAFPMTAATGSLTDTKLKFRNIGGAIKLNLIGYEIIRRITLNGNAGETISGSGSVTVFVDGSVPEFEFTSDASSSIELDCGEEGIHLDYWRPTEFIFTLPPTTFESGFTFTIEEIDGTSHTISSDKNQEVGRSQILNMPARSLRGDISTETSIETISVTPFDITAKIRIGTEYYYAEFGNSEYLTSAEEFVDGANNQYLSLWRNNYPHGFIGNPKELIYGVSGIFTPGESMTINIIPYIEGKTDYTVDDICTMTWELPRLTEGGALSPVAADVNYRFTQVDVEFYSEGAAGLIMKSYSPEYFEQIPDVAADLIQSRYTDSVWAIGERYEFSSGVLGEGGTIVIAAIAVDSNGNYGEPFVQSYTLSGISPGGSIVPEVTSFLSDYDRVIISIAAPGASYIHMEMLPEREYENLGDPLEYLKNTGSQPAYIEHYDCFVGIPDEKVILFAIAVDNEGRYGEMIKESYSTAPYVFNEDIKVIVESTGGDINGYWLHAYTDADVERIAASVYRACSYDWLWNGDIDKTSQILAINSDFFSWYSYGNQIDFPTGALEYDTDYIAIVMAQGRDGRWSRPGYLEYRVDFVEEAWSVIGSFNEWNGDIEMTYNYGTSQYEALGIPLEADTEFKFRKDKNWNVNRGAPYSYGDPFYVNPDVSFPMEANGANCKLYETGIYNFYLSKDTYSGTIEYVGPITE